MSISIHSSARIPDNTVLARVRSSGGICTRAFRGRAGAGAGGGAGAGAAKASGAGPEGVSRAVRPTEVLTSWDASSRGVLALPAPELVARFGAFFRFAGMAVRETHNVTVRRTAAVLQYVARPSLSVESAEL